MSKMRSDEFVAEKISTKSNQETTEMKRRNVHEVLANVDSEEKPKSNAKVPSYSHLKNLVSEVVKTKTWWELYGVDLTILFLTSAVLVPAGFLLLRSSNVIVFTAGFLTMAYLHYIYASKGAHMAGHGSLGKSKVWNYLLGRFFSEVCGGFTFEGAEDIHIKVHHPYTNIVGLGDSSTWRAPFLSRTWYFFIAPLFLPLLAPLLSIHLIWGQWKHIFMFLPCMFLGMTIHYQLLRTVSGFSILGALLCMFATRGLFSTVYVHINIFQHIGLSFYSLENRPARLHQMATGVLNLKRNIFLDSCFGHSITTCHVEHHLFPQFSDNICLAIKPLVSGYFKTHNLPYNEDTYSNRLKIFYEKYTELMVHAPPITDFVGVQ